MMIVLFATRTSTRTSEQFFLEYLRINFIICENIFLYNNKIHIIYLLIYVLYLVEKFPSLAMKTTIDC